MKSVPAILAIALTVPALVLTAACGNEGDAKSAVQELTRNGPPITNPTFEALLASDDFGKRGLALDCVAMRTEIDGYRIAFKASDEWGALTKTTPWTTLAQSLDNYANTKCPTITEEHDNVGDVCEKLGDNVVDNWAAVQDSPAWQAAQANSNLQNLVNKWNQAKGTGCIAHGS